MYELNRHYFEKLSYQKTRGFFSKIREIPWLLFLLVVVQFAVGEVMMYSAGGGSIYPWAYKQLIHFLAFLPIAVTISVINIRTWYNSSYSAYFAVLLMLVAVKILGHSAMGATRWVNLGIIKFQPSELMKIAIILALARYFSSMSTKEVGRISVVIPAVLMVIIPSILIMKQPDLGTAMILLFISAMMLFVAGVRLWKFALVAGLAGGAAPIIWGFLRDYQKKRIITFLNPENDPLGAGYNIIQSKIAIGSGGISGKGLIGGTQSQLSFLPERQTDFIFTMLAEELGFIGGSFIIIMFGLIIAYGVIIATCSKDHFGRLVAAGITSMLFCHVFINIAMVMGLLPVVGVPLPLFSYGGTIMMTSLISVGLLSNVYVHRNEEIRED